MKRLYPFILFAFIALLGFFFAMTEIQIEGSNGWASGLPTWKIENHVLLNIFWGGRPLTGYHAWIFSFMFLVFHLPHMIYGRLSLLLEVRIIGSLMLFWIIEDCFWFVLNPAFGVRSFGPEHVWWHKVWLFGIPLDYWTFGILGIVLIIFSFRVKKRLKASETD